MFAVHAGAAASTAPAPAEAGQPAVLVPRLLARLVPIADIGAREQLAAAALLALAAALIAHLVAASRGDRAATLGGAVAGLWLAASPAGWALAGSLSPDIVALGACAALLAVHDRLARGGGAASAGLLGVVAALALLADGRGALLVAVAGALVAYRGRRGARWVALAPAHGAVVTLVLVAAAALAGGLRWPAAPVGQDPSAWLATLVDDLGPVALVVGAVGVGLAVRGRSDRWLAAALLGGLVVALPPSRPVAPAALVALAVGVGLAVAAAARAAERAVSSGAPAAGPWAVAVALAAVLVVPPALRSATTAQGRDRVRVSSYAAAPWMSSPATGR